MKNKTCTTKEIPRYPIFLSDKPSMPKQEFLGMRIIVMGMLFSKEMPRA